MEGIVKERLSGFLLIDKPSGPSSYDIIRLLKPLLPRGIKIGHAGTLDPLASGLLIIGIGREATRALGRLLKLPKTYEVTAVLGKRYDTLDVTGTLLGEQDASHITKARFRGVLREFCGEQEQIPPMFSAVKHKGKALYKLAQEGKEIERKPRKIVIKEIHMRTWKNPYLSFMVACSSGTYVRVLVDDIGKKLGVGAAVAKLRRTQIGPFSVSEAVQVEKILTSNGIKKFFLEKENFL